LNAAAGRSTVARAYGVGKVSMNLLSKNLSTQLMPTTDDQALFGLTGSTPAAVANMANAMITTVKAFALGLTSMLIMKGINDDPHGRFIAGDDQARMYARAMGKMLNGLQQFAKSVQDPSCTTKTLADNVVFSVSGDTFKSPFNRTAWPDATPSNSNMLYAMGGGWLKSGFFGDMDPTAGAGGWDPATGADAPYAGAPLGQAASAAVLFAIAKGDMRRVRDFYTGRSIDGIVNANVTG
jgi:hypothetical protein